MRKPGHGIWHVTIILAGLAAILLQGQAVAAEAKEYAYAVISGQIIDPVNRVPMAGATIRLFEAGVGEGGEAPRVFEEMTDDAGSFFFARLPLSTWRLEVETADGELIRGLSVLYPEADQARLVLGVTRRIQSETEVSTGRGPRFIVVGYEPTKWKRFWSEALIFVAGGGALGLGL